MIRCNNISKKYQFDQVLINFSYSFPDKGIVLLYGESGCGKTTLLNILAGVTNFDSGDISFGDTNYLGSVDIDKINNIIGYITQDPHFIDYLTVLDNLKLCSTDDKHIETVLSKFGLQDKKNNYPNKLSTGEKQRIAIMQALLSEKSILFLDEPTASLDRENKTIIFDILKHIKTSKLIIFSSHDDEAKKYADEIIDFSNLHNIKQLTKSVSYSTNIRRSALKKKRALQPFVDKFHSFPGREKKSRILLVIVFMLTMMSICLMDTPDHKKELNKKHVYGLNQLQVTCTNINESLFEDFKNNEKVKEVVLDYSRSVPMGIDYNNENDIFVDVNYNISVHTIPYSPKAFRLSNRILYGSYFTKPEQIILANEMAISMGNPEDLIGETMKVDMYDKSYNFEIVGIFDKFTKVEAQYFEACGSSILGSNRDTFYINGEFAKRYINNEDFYNDGGERHYVVYFDTFDSMKSNYKYYKANDKNVKFYESAITTELSLLFENIPIVLVPIVLSVILISMLLYYQIRKTEMVYNKHIFSVYQYLGYSIYQIQKCWVVSNNKDIVRILLISLIGTTPIIWIINMINKQTYIIPFQIFSFNIYTIVLFIISISIISTILSLHTLKKIKITGWYQVLLEQRDLI